jgi:hypothetical protein
MSGMSDDILGDAKLLINGGDLEALQSFYTDMLDTYDADSIDYPYMFRHIYVHACLKKKHDIVKWLKEMYETMDPIMKIALRQIFPYGEHLLRRPI